ncbi:MAG: MoaD/ThiS family protein [Deltaproteobacteria bacterium]|nr:MoaD/ThiS family protein [Deltaproteobacteria bacterium]MBW1960285.1 MoaD/ThiS family protein [Deltaproteobacteria bacterium]MBW2150301.1 MoaD/ThiS family protein [Deltaproteobacteria bacterium]
METHIKLELLATLKRYSPDSPEQFRIKRGIKVRDLLAELNIPEYEVNLVFINGQKGNLDSILNGGERVGLFPPLGGG